LTNVTRRVPAAPGGGGSEAAGAEGDWAGEEAGEVEVEVEVEVAGTRLADADADADRDADDLCEDCPVARA
jgi:hypothetical protein